MRDDKPPEPPNEPRYILAKIAPETREVKYPVEVLGEMYIIHRQGQTRNITKLPGMVGFKCFEYDDGFKTLWPKKMYPGLGIKTAKFAVFEEKESEPCK